MLSEQEQQLLYKFLNKEINEIQLNYWCIQKNYNKDLILECVKRCERTSLKVVIALAVFMFIVFPIFLNFIFGMIL